MAKRIVLFIEDEGLDQSGCATTPWFSNKDLEHLESVRAMMEEQMWHDLDAVLLTEVDPDEEEDDGD